MFWKNKKRILGVLLVLTLIVGQLSGINFKKVQAADTGYTELTFSDFGLDGDYTASQSGSSTKVTAATGLDGVAFTGYVTFPENGTADWTNEIRIGNALKITPHENDQARLRFLTGSNSGLGISSSLDSTVMGRKIKLRVEFTLSGTADYQAVVYVDETQVGSVTCTDGVAKWAEWAVAYIGVKSGETMSVASYKETTDDTTGDTTTTDYTELTFSSFNIADQTVSGKATESYYVQGTCSSVASGASLDGVAFTGLVTMPSDSTAMTNKIQFGNLLYVTTENTDTLRLRNPNNNQAYGDGFGSSIKGNQIKLRLEFDVINSGADYQVKAYVNDTLCITTTITGGVAQFTYYPLLVYAYTAQDVIVGSYPKRKTYTVEATDLTNLYISNATASNGPVTLQYTVESATTDTITQNGVIASSDPQGTHPYNGTGEMNYYQWSNLLFDVGRTYTVTMGIENGDLVYTVSLDNGETKTFPSTAGSISGTEQYFGIWIGVDTASIKLTNVSCVDAEGNDLGLQTNKSEAKITGEDIKTYTVQATNLTNLYISNATASSGPVTLTYTVQSATSDTVTQNGVIASSDPQGSYPYNGTGKMHYTNNGNLLFDVGRTYTVTMGIENGSMTYTVSLDNGETKTFPSAYGSLSGSEQYFGIWVGTDLVSFTLTNVSCVDAKGNDLGLQANKSTCTITEGEVTGPVEPGEDVVRYVVEAEDTNKFFLSNATASDGPITLSYTVKSSTYTSSQTGVVATTDGLADYPYLSGRMIYTNNGNMLLDEERTYTITIGAGSDVEYSISLDNGETKTFPSTTGSLSGSEKYYGIWIAAGLATFKLTRVTCIDAKGNDLGIQCNRSTVVVRESTPEDNYIYETVEANNDYRNEDTGATGLWLNVANTRDSLATGTYEFETGGIYVNEELVETATMEKKADDLYYVTAGSREFSAGDIIKVDGRIVSGDYWVTFSPVTFIYNKDGTFSKYDPSITAADKEIVLEDVWVDISEGNYVIPSTPFKEGFDVEVKVNGSETTDYTLSELGQYEIERRMEYISHASATNAYKDLVYKNTVSLYQFGDGNADGNTSVKDLVRIKQQKEEKSKNPALDLDGNAVIEDNDHELLLDVLVGNKTLEKVKEQRETDVTFGVIGDTHYQATYSDSQRRINTIKALNYYKSLNVELIILNGDVTDLGEEASYEKLVADIKTVYPDDATRPTIIFTADNHEYYDALNGDATFEEVKERFTTGLSTLRDGNASVNSSYEVAGYHFIGVSADGSSDGTATYTSETVNWLSEQLAAAKTADADKPIFVSVHQPPQNTVYGSSSEALGLEEVLKDYPQVVLFTSHTHVPLNDERSIHQNDYTTLNTATLYYADDKLDAINVPVTDETGISEIAQNIAQGLLVRVNGSKTDIERVDFWNDATIKDNWVVDTALGTEGFTYTDARSANRTAPTFPSDGAVTVERGEDGSATLTFTTADHDDFVQHYIVEAYINVDALPDSTYTYSSLYFLGEDQMGDTQTIKVEGLSPDREYYFSVKAVESYGNVSEPLCSWPTDEEPIEVDVSELLDLKHTLRADENGNFKVLMLSDVQSNQTVLEQEIQDNIKKAVEHEQPDLVIFGGDNSYNMKTEEQLRSYLDGMVGYLEEQQIPWAHVYGNHDDETSETLTPISKEAQQAVYESYDYCVSKAGDASLQGVGNYVLPVLEHTGDKIAYNVWAFDSGSYLNPPVPDVISTDGKETFTGAYQYITKRQIKWYRAASDALKEYNGGDEIPAMMYFHVPLQEHWYAWNARETENLVYNGTYAESLGAPAINCGLFDAVLEQGDVKLIAAAHIHANDQYVEWKGVALCNSSTIGTHAYHVPERLGGRVIEFSATGDKPVTSYMSYLKDY